MTVMLMKNPAANHDAHGGDDPNVSVVVCTVSSLSHVAVLAVTVTVNQDQDQCFKTRGEV